MLVTGDILSLRRRLPQGFSFKNWEGFDNRAEVLITAVAVVVSETLYFELLAKYTTVTYKKKDYYQKTDGVLGPVA